MNFRIQNKLTKNISIHTFGTVNTFRKIIFLPLTLIYGLILRVRHFCFDSGFITSVKHPVPTIGVGNLALGGTGKTPLTCFLIEHFSKKFSVAIVSRGYGRKTKGYVLANSNSTAAEIGDEPMIYVTRFPEVQVAVCEKRNVALRCLLDSDHPPELVILDDCMQHRALSVNTLLLTTTEKSPYWKDMLLPSGRLRDIKYASKLAHAVIITKSTSDSVTTSLDKPIYKTYSEFSEPKSVNGVESNTEKCTIFSGIANNNDFKSSVSVYCDVEKSFSYSDHHIYSNEEIEEIISHCNAQNTQRVVTTEKDFQRLTSAQIKLFSKLSLQVLQLDLKFYEEKKFLNFIETRVSENV